MDGQKSHARLVLVVLIVIAVVGLAACDLSNSGVVTDTFGVQVTSVGGKAGFTPPTLNVNKGDTVIVNLSNPTSKEHGFSIDEFGVHTTVAPRSVTMVRFVANRSGVFRVYCQLHAGHQPIQLVVAVT